MNKKLLLAVFTVSVFINHQLVFAANEYSDAHEDVLLVNPQLTLQDVLQKTLVRQPQQASLQAKSYEVQAKEVMAKSLLPHAPAVSIYHQNDTIGSGRNERDFQAELEFSVWLPKQRDARAKVAALTFQALGTDKESLNLHAAGSLRDAVWDIAINQNEVELYQQKQKHAQQLQQDVEKRYKAGESAKTDLLLIEQDTLMAQKNLLRAEAELMHAKFRYTLLTGLQEIPQNIEEKQSEIANFMQSPLWLAAEARVAQAQGERELTEVEKRENMQVILNARSSQGAFDDQYNQSVGLRLRIPLDSGVRGAPLIAASEMALGESITRRETLRYSLEAEMHEAEHNLEVSQKELEITVKQFEIAKNSAELARKAYKLGELDLTSLLRIQTQAFEAERNHTAKQIQVKWNVARYNQAVGVLP